MTGDVVPRRAVVQGTCRHPSGDDVRVRALRVSDIAEVCRIQDHCYVAITPESAESLAAKIQAAPASCFLAESGARALAYVIAMPWREGDVVPLDSPACVLPDAPDCLYVHDLAVHPDAAGLGVGNRLIAAVLQAAQAMGLSRQCLVAIQGAQTFWQRQGFAVVAVDAALQRKLAGYGGDAVYMRRQAQA